VRLVKRIHILDVIFSVLFNNREQFLLQMQMRSTLDSDSLDGEGDNGLTKFNSD